MPPFKRYPPWRSGPRPRACLTTKNKPTVQPRMVAAITTPKPFLHNQNPKPVVIPIVRASTPLKPMIIRPKPPSRKQTPTVHPFFAKQHKIRQPKESELVLREPPSIYFRRSGKTINPTVYLN